MTASPSKLLAGRAQNPTLAQAIGMLILDGRDRLGMSQRGLAKRMNITPTAVRKWEQGLSAPMAPKLIELSKLFGFDIRDLRCDMPAGWNSNTSSGLWPSAEVGNSGTETSAASADDHKPDAA